jgi:steroid delta-isomerase-like uncharacterized protein
LEDTWNTGNVTTLDEMASTDYVWHDAAGRVTHGTTNAKLALSRFRTAFPDFHIVTEDILAEGDKVGLRWTVRGTHRGQMELLQNIPPTGKQVTWLGMDIYHFRGGKIVEGGRSWDRLGLFQQVGLVP